MKQGKTPLISVIVPIYNDAPFLHRCIDSILSQTYHHIELILVDDGSTDGSAALCDEYSKQDCRVHVIHKMNGGTVSARACGIEHAQGSVVSFIDGDDWIDKEMYETLIDCYIQNGCPDLVSSGLIWEYITEASQKVTFDGASEGKYEKEAIEQEIMPVLIQHPILRRAFILTSVCTKLVAKPVAKEAMEFMSPSLTLGEDGAYVYFLVACCQSISILHKAFYHYEQHTNSQNSQFDTDIFQRLSVLKKGMADGLERLGWGQCREVSSQIDFYVWSYVQRAVREKLNINPHGSAGLFPFAKCDRGSVVLVYGAGIVGKTYVRCLIQSGYASKIIWTDQRYRELQAEGYQVISLEEALQEGFDCIVIAIENESVADAVKEELLMRGAAQEKIIWEKTTWLDSYEWNDISLKL